MAIEKSDWSKIRTDDLITIHEAFEQAVEDEDGLYVIRLTPVHWSRCFGLKVEIGHERQKRDELA